MYIVILAGGSGTRFWPLSRKKTPKQLMSVLGGKSMLQRTIERVIPLNPKRILIVTNRLQAHDTSLQIDEYRSLVPLDIIEEPTGRNTAPAAGLAAAIIEHHQKGGVMVVLPADHYIRDENSFRGALHHAVHCAENGYLVTIGITPVRPETGYGYIEADQSGRGDSPYPVKRFIEKPPLSKALEFLESGNFYWNSGMFVWRSSTILESLKRYANDTFEKLSRYDFGEAVWDISDLVIQSEAIYPELHSESIDYAVMEKADNVMVIPAEFGWSDVGSWSALPELLSSDDDGCISIYSEELLKHDSTGCLVCAKDKVTALVGVKDLTVVCTDDAILVCSNDRAQDVKKIVEKLEQTGMNQYL